MSSKKSQSSRANGSKSQGPATPAGRARSSQNALRHGLRASSLVLPHESARDFQDLLDAYRAEFAPQTLAEAHAVETMASARWRLQRILSMEALLFENELEDQTERLDKYHPDMDIDHRIAWIFRDVANHGSSLALIVRYEGSLHRAYQRAFKQLQRLQAARVSPRPNEPTPPPAPALPVGDPGALESGHLPVQPQGSLRQVDPQSRAGAFSQPHVQIEQRPRPQKLQHLPMPPLRRAVREHHVIQRRWVQPPRDQRRRARNESVQH